MGRNTTPRQGSRSLLSGLMLLSVMACGGEERARTGATTARDTLTSPLNDTVAALAPVTPTTPDTAARPMPPRMTSTVPLLPAGQLQARGIAQLAALGHRTSVAASLTGAQAGVSYAGDIRGGTCRQVGSRVASLHPVTADSLGGGRASTNISVPMDSLLKVPHVVVYGQGGRPELCGEMPSGDPLAVPSPVPADSV
jgi:hypothetical protein